MAVTSCRARTLSPLRGVSARLVSGGLERWRRRDTGPSFVDPLQRESLIPALSAEAAREVAAALLGCPVNAATQVPASAEHQVFRIERDDVIAFLKVADAAHLKPELAVLQLLSGRGVPVPVIEAADPDGGRTGFSCVVIRDVGGVPLSHDCAEFAGIGPLLRQVHDVTLGGFGFLIATAGGLIGQDGTWHDAMRQRIQGLELVGEAGLAEPALLARAVAAVDDRIGRLDTPEPGRLIHGDFHPRHVYAADGRVTGIIDWGDASCGDPLYDFGRILQSATVAGGVGHGITVVSQVRQAYGDAPWLQADRPNRGSSMPWSSRSPRCTASSPAARPGRRGGQHRPPHSLPSSARWTADTTCTDGSRALPIGVADCRLGSAWSPTSYCSTALTTRGRQHDDRQSLRPCSDLRSRRRSPRSRALQTRQALRDADLTERRPWP